MLAGLMLMMHTPLAIYLPPAGLWITATVDFGVRSVLPKGHRNM